MLATGKSGLVTGAAGGIGRATALAFAREGAAVVVADLPARETDLEETVRLITDSGGTATAVTIDVTNEDDQDRAAAFVVETFGALDFAHNNAGIEVQKTVLETTVEDYDRVQAVNAKGVFLGLKAQLPIMKAQGSGAIVNTASLLGLVGLPGLAAYVASKHAVVGLTKVAAIEHAGDGIRVNSVCPAATGTEMMLHLPPERQADLVAPQAIKRIADPNEIAEVVVWLASDRASFITGANIPADAGATAM